MRLACVQRRQPNERIVERHEQVSSLVDREPIERFEWHSTRPIAALDRVLSAGVIHENTPHRPRGDGKEMRPVVERATVLQPQIRLVHQRRRAQAVPLRFSGEMPVRHFAQLVVYLRKRVRYPMHGRIRVGARSIQQQCGSNTGERALLKVRSRPNMPARHGAGNTMPPPVGANPILVEVYMRPSIAFVALLASAIAACGENAPTAPTTSVDVSSRSASGQRLGTLRPFDGSCSLTFNSPPFPLPPIHHQIDTGTCWFTHLGLTDFYGEQDINFAAGTQTGTRTFTAANGDKLFLTNTGTSRPGAPGEINFRAQFTIIGGTGRFAGATGGGIGTGTAHLTTNSTSVTIVGTISY